MGTCEDHRMYKNAPGREVYRVYPYTRLFSEMGISSSQRICGTLQFSLWHRVTARIGANDGRYCTLLGGALRIEYRSSSHQYVERNNQRYFTLHLKFVFINESRLKKVPENYRLRRQKSKTIWGI